MVPVPFVNFTWPSEAFISFTQNKLIQPYLLGLNAVASENEVLQVDRCKLANALTDSC